jgi:hypothetical protein
MIKDSAAHCNAVLFAPIVVAPGCFVGHVGYHQFYLGVFVLRVVAWLWRP